MDDPAPLQEPESSDNEEVGSIFGRPSIICPVRLFLKTIDNYWQLDLSKMEARYT